MKRRNFIVSFAFCMMSLLGSCFSSGEVVVSEETASEVVISEAAVSGKEETNTVAIPAVKVVLACSACGEVVADHTVENIATSEKEKEESRTIIQCCKCERHFSEVIVVFKSGLVKRYPKSKLARFLKKALSSGVGEGIGVGLGFLNILACEDLKYLPKFFLDLPDTVRFCTLLAFMFVAGNVGSVYGWNFLDKYEAQVVEKLITVNDEKTVR
jgi:hypothetical protein